MTERADRPHADLGQRVTERVDEPLRIVQALGPGRDVQPAGGAVYRLLGDPGKAARTEVYDRTSPSTEVGRMTGPITRHCAPTAP